jgi:predicted regulator of Ras-like GTPase activity (Roadblock/LC7/MglB family)
MFRAALERLRGSVPGTVAVSLIDLDGIPIDSALEADFPLDIWNAEFATFARTLRLSLSELDPGPIEQVALFTGKYVALLSAVTSDYYILMVMSRGGSYGRARFELMKARFHLRDELS